MSIRRFSSRTHRLDASFLMQHLAGARSYKRIAGYFTSSFLNFGDDTQEGRRTHFIERWRLEVPLPDGTLVSRPLQAQDYSSLVAAS